MMIQIIKMTKMIKVIKVIMMIQIIKITKMIKIIKTIKTSRNITRNFPNQKLCQIKNYAKLKIMPNQNYAETEKCEGSSCESCTFSRCLSEFPDIPNERRLIERLATG